MNKLVLCRSQKGQGTIEYLLILMITVVLILTIITQFNQSFRSYATKFFDGYIACLLETGELPNGGGDCSESFDDYNPNEGKPYLAGDPIGDWVKNAPEPGSGQADGSGSSGDGKNGDGSSSGSGSNSGGSGSGGREVAGNASSGGGGSNGSTAVGSLRGGRFGARRSTPVGKADAKDKKDSGNADSMLASTAVGGVSGDSSRSGRKKALTGGFQYFGQEQKESRENERPPVAAVAKDSEGNDSLKPKKAVEPERKPTAVVEKEETGFSFGYLIKMLLICGIGVAIVVFFGGQILQASKSWEK
ncbi:MAG: hypothetical protein V4692_06685 [Bdellovibrionota bacterium]